MHDARHVGALHGYAYTSMGEEGGKWLLGEDEQSHGIMGRGRRACVKYQGLS